MKPEPGVLYWSTWALVRRCIKARAEYVPDSLLSGLWCTDQTLRRPPPTDHFAPMPKFIEEDRFFERELRYPDPKFTEEDRFFERELRYLDRLIYGRKFGDLIREPIWYA